jgi:phosphoglycolate phosphatase
MNKVAVFDLDGTLVHSAPDIHAAVNRVMQRRGLAPYSLAEVTAMIGDGTRVLVTRAFAGRGRPFEEAGHDELLADPDISNARLTAPFAGIAEALDAIEAAGWQLAICTNKPEAAARGLLASLGLGGRFAAIGGGDSFPVRKPDPEHLRATLKAAGGAPEAAVMIGDHRNDVQAAAGCGVACIFAAWGYGPRAMADGAPVAEQPGDLPRLLGSLGS